MLIYYNACVVPETSIECLLKLSLSQFFSFFLEIVNFFKLIHISFFSFFLSFFHSFFFNSHVSIFREKLKRLTIIYFFDKWFANTHTDDVFTSWSQVCDPKKLYYTHAKPNRNVKIQNVPLLFRASSRVALFAALLYWAPRARAPQNFEKLFKILYIIKQWESISWPRDTLLYERITALKTYLWWKYTICL